MGNVQMCPQCESNNIKSSTTRTDSCRTTLLMPVQYYDNETNSWKVTNPNKITYTYQCQYGHHFEV